jgi:hypothetical protein
MGGPKRHIQPERYAKCPTNIWKFLQKTLTKNHCLEYNEHKILEVKMKKTFFHIFFWLLVVSVQVMAQSKPIMGYDKVTWGTSEKIVRETYSIGPDILTEKDKNDPNIYVLKQQNVSDTITERGFWFNEDKLYRVYVEYKDWSSNTMQNLQNILENRFGSRTGFDTDMQQTMLAFQTVYYKTTISEFGKYSPDLLVELIQGVLYTSSMEMDSMNLLGQNSLVVRYTWKKYRDEYQASKLGL